MAFKLNVQRKFKAPVSIGVLTEAGEELTGEFHATFKMLNEEQTEENSKEMMLDAILVELHDLELFDGDIKLEGDDLMRAAKADAAISKALARSYWEHFEKKPQSKT